LSIFGVMKNNSNKITLAYVVILIIVAYVAHKLVFRYFPISSIEKLELYNYIKDVVLILISALVFKFLINQNEKHNRNVLKI